jgi:DNA polymerase III epsilon subunit-like protein
MIVLDIETTGIDPRKHCMLSLGAVDYESGETFYGECCIFGNAKVDQRALEINGFTLEEIRPGEKQCDFQLYISFLAWVDQFPNKLLAGHNVGHFDILFLEQIHNQKINEGTPWPFVYRTVDLHTVAFLKFGESLSHEKICERLGIPPEPKPHNALRGALSERDCLMMLGVKACP